MYVISSTKSVSYIPAESRGDLTLGKMGEGRGEACYVITSRVSIDGKESLDFYICNKYITGQPNISKVSWLVEGSRDTSEQDLQLQEVFIN